MEDSVSHNKNTKEILILILMLLTGRTAELPVLRGCAPGAAGRHEKQYIYIYIYIYVYMQGITNNINIHKKTQKKETKRTTNNIIIKIRKKKN